MVAKFRGQRLQFTMVGSICRVWMEVLRIEGILIVIVRISSFFVRCCGFFSFIYQGSSFLDFFLFGFLVFSYYLDGRLVWVSGGLQGENGIVINQDVEVMQSFSGNFLVFLVIRCFVQYIFRVVRCCFGRFQKCLFCKVFGLGRSGIQMVIYNLM